MSAVSTKSLRTIATEQGVDVGHLSYVSRGERDGAYEHYVALRKASYPLTLAAIEREAAAKIRHLRKQKKAKAATQAEATK